MLDMKRFDDITTDDYGTWTQVCEHHSEELQIPQAQLDDAGQGTCGVKGCEAESEYYVDFKEDDLV